MAYYLRCLTTNIGETCANSMTSTECYNKNQNKSLKYRATEIDDTSFNTFVEMYVIKE